ncbi:MAG: glycosyltransferase family 2 protein, partial [Spirochaetales bacterium]|nr:glycosyltransferase family 2 protein [Spirochaetales bacterium]
MLKPKITIMIPTYNQEKYIEKAIESALSINYSNLEIVLSDDCSTDNTFDIAKKYETDSRFKAFRCSTNIGRVNNYKHLLQDLATGDWVINCDGDDYLINTDFFNDSMAKSIENNDIVIFSSNRYKLKENSLKLYPQESYNKDNLINGTELFLNYYKFHSGLYHITSLYNREIAIKAGFYTQDIISSDMESLLRIIPGRKVYHFDYYSAVWRDHDVNVSKSIDAAKRANNLLMINSLYKYHLENNTFNKNILDQWKKSFYINRIIRIGNRFLTEFKFSIFFNFLSLVNRQEKGVVFKAVTNHKLLLTILFPYRIKFKN